MYHYLFGPVPSRRLGQSLGIDLVPHKTCSYDCVYCECGRTTNLTLERLEYVDTKRVLEELHHFLEHHPAPDYLTFSGFGEPTLHQNLGQVLQEMKARFPDQKVAVLTNGSLLQDPEVRTSILQADVVLPSLDAVSDDVFQQLNRPHHQIRVQNVIEGLRTFRQAFPGVIWLEVFIVPGLNDTDSELTLLRQTITTIQPDKIQLNTLDRPGSEPDVQPATNEELQRIVDLWQLSELEIIASAYYQTVPQSGRPEMSTRILSTIARRPCTVQDLVTMLEVDETAINRTLKELLFLKKIKTITQKRGIFYCLR